MALQQKQHDADMEARGRRRLCARNLVRASTTKMAQSRRKQQENGDHRSTAHLPHRSEVPLHLRCDATTRFLRRRIFLSLGGKRLVEGLDLLVKRENAWSSRARTARENPRCCVCWTARSCVHQAGTVRLGAGAKASLCSNSNNNSPRAARSRQHDLGQISKIHGTRCAATWPS